MLISRRHLAPGLAALVLLLAGCGSSGSCDPDTQAPLAILAAMPSELAPLLERASIRTTEVIDRRAFHSGTLGGVPVVVAMTGIGLVNATETSRLLLDHFAVGGVVFSGVAGSPHRIADVTVPLSWSEPDGPSYPADAGWLDLARKAAAPGVVELERCTHVPPDDPASDLVCMPFAPAIFVSGRGSSSDPFGGAPALCRPGGTDVFGCDPALDAPASATTASSADASFAPEAAVAAEEELTVDMESAAVAREATARGLRFIAFRAVSDGSEDPLGLPGFPTQFFTYYRLAARNAAIATTAFLAELAQSQSDDLLCS